MILDNHLDDRITQAKVLGVLGGRFQVARDALGQQKVHGTSFE